ncbi:hypothetical protein KNE206_58260 [Kitasatospora sp. NE20-6]
MVDDLSQGPPEGRIRNCRAPETTPVSGAGMRGAFGSAQVTPGRHRPGAIRRSGFPLVNRKGLQRTSRARASIRHRGPGPVPDGQKGRFRTFTETAHALRRYRPVQQDLSLCPLRPSDPTVPAGHPAETLAIADRRIRAPASPSLMFHLLQSPCRSFVSR